MTTDTRSIDERLLPCPFCGAPADPPELYGESKTAMFIDCSGCGASVYRGTADKEANRTAVIKAWNRRTQSEGAVRTEGVLQPTEPGAFKGDIWFGHPEKRNLGTHRWDGEKWEVLPDEIEGALSLLAQAREEIASLKSASLPQHAQSGVVEAVLAICADHKARTDVPKRDDWQLGYADACREISVDVRRLATPSPAVAESELRELGSLLDWMIGHSYKRIETADPDAKHRFFTECSLCGGDDVERKGPKSETALVSHAPTCLLGKFKTADDILSRLRPTQTEQDNG